MPLDPQAKAVMDQVAALGFPAVHTVSPPIDLRPDPILYRLVNRGDRIRTCDLLTPRRI